ncbi:hypothetical protein FRC07_012500 [Ceratobasidium sp. 392]|nr:hypothetical protein FRC07_012500 [Ceratobasidium sp. 392]
MPLRSLSLWLVVFSPEDYTAGESEDEGEDEDREIPPVYYPTIGWRDFLAALPLVERLELSMQTLHSSQLPIFASMLPHLQSLTLSRVKFSGTEEIPGTIAMRPAAHAITISMDDPKVEAPGSAAISNAARFVVQGYE